MQEWPKSERPGEKLLESGASALSNKELLAVLMHNGQAQESALQISSALLNKFGTLRKLISASKSDFCTVPGGSEVKYAQLQAAMEIVKRQYEESLRRVAVFHHSNDVVKYLQCQLRDLAHEVFAILMLDSQHQLIAYRQLFRGTINASAVYPREIIKKVLSDNASAVILVHNHPSGIAEPSQTDILMTKRIQSALDLIDVPLLDHFIVGDTTSVSMAQRGVI